jgi:hypothetical protein
MVDGGWAPQTGRGRQTLRSEARGRDDVRKGYRDVSTRSAHTRRGVGGDGWGSALVMTERTETSRGGRQRLVDVEEAGQQAATRAQGDTRAR